ncbi:alpha-N-acetylglucosaminidase C-terminal domain-containing protein [Streptomyces deccanensis]|uniref:alpha-N-acetylglucosaminidase C-terminal domain-containing protein n=1 Tax=Streptomyces deccanensis TaxID=424188 RepID=UPI001EFB4168|nr:alpha-N-acetylglucosaminidase C-terminal domain-containing protein [Streptomyces deccanensis]ULR54384.1 alpha-N-acetylglucosaminidase C-terminal domain-containing protein [Streptomyces deccanensis]
MTRADGWSKAPDGLFGARPSLGANKAAAWGPEANRHDTAAFDLALTESHQVAPALRDNSACCYDLADAARQVLSNQYWPGTPVRTGCSSRSGWPVPSPHQCFCA